MVYSFEITPRSPEVGRGWRLRLLENSEEVGGGVFPVAPADPHQGMTWWNTIAEVERSYWLGEAGSARPADAYDAFLLAEAYADAENEAYAWLDAHDQVTVKLVHGQLVAFLPDRRTLASADAVQLADLLLAAGVSADQLRMPDWQDDSAPLSGHKVAILARMRA